MFKLETFVEDCLSAVKEEPKHKATSEVIKRDFADPGAILNELGEPTGPGIQPIYNSPELTILNLVWKPSITIMPHNHEMWAVIGIYGGREDNIFWRRIADDPHGQIEAAAAVMSVCNPETTLFNVISKSGETAETAAQFMIVRDRLVVAVHMRGRHYDVVGCVQTERNEQPDD